MILQTTGTLTPDLVGVDEVWTYAYYSQVLVGCCITMSFSYISSLDVWARTMILNSC